MSMLRHFIPNRVAEAGASQPPARVSLQVSEAEIPPENPALQGEVTQLLQQMVDGRQSAADTLMPLVYDELRRIARSCMRRERSDHTLEPTALVHEAYLRLAGQHGTEWQSRGHFFSVAARMMRRILVDSSRTRLRHKRGNGAQREEYIEADIIDCGHGLSAVDVLAINEALDQLAKVDARMVQIVELRFFAGLGTLEIAEMLGLSEPTIKRSWSVARAWLARQLAGA